MNVKGYAYGVLFLFFFSFGISHVSYAMKQNNKNELHDDRSAFHQWRHDNPWKYHSGVTVLRSLFLHQVLERYAPG